MMKRATVAAAWFTWIVFAAPGVLAQEEQEVVVQEEDPGETEDTPEEAEAEEEEVDAESDAESEVESEVESEYDEQAPEEPEIEQDCSNEIDDDEDGDIDCDDYDCLDEERCYEDETEVEDEIEDETPTPDVTLVDDEEEQEPDELLDLDEEADESEWRERPVNMFEVHGYLRLRGDLFHNMAMATVQSGSEPYDLRPGRNFYPRRPLGDLAGVVCDEGEICRNSTLAGMNMRFRFEPVINIGDQVRIMAQIDLLDNIVLGSTPEGSYFDPSSGGGAMSPWVPLRFFAGSQAPPSERNSLSDAISIRRVWAEVTTPLGQLHFGRMGTHWGLGMMQNNGNEIDDDNGDIVDRISLAARLWGMMLVPGVEFVHSGATSQIWGDTQGQPVDAAQLDDIMQYFLVIARQLPREEQQDRMRRGDLIINGGLYFAFRNQVLSQELIGADGSASDFVYRNAWAVVPDLWFQLYFRGFHFELEFGIVGGNIGNNEPDGYDSASATDLLQFGAVGRADFTALDGQLNVGLEFGYASGDAEYEGLTPRQADGPLSQEPGFDGSSVNSLFRFDPDFNVDMILFEQILGQVAGAYYIRPWVSYEFISDVIGVRADVIYSLASEPLSTIGNSPHLGVEINAAIWFRGRSPFNFTAMLQYGVLFPLSGWKDPFYDGFEDLEYPQTVQGLVAVHY